MCLDRIRHFETFLDQLKILQEKKKSSCKHFRNPVGNDPYYSDCYITGEDSSLPKMLLFSEKITIVNRECILWSSHCAECTLYTTPLNPLNNSSVISILKWGNKLKKVKYLGGEEDKGDDNNNICFIGLLQRFNEVIFLTQLEQCLEHKKQYLNVC